MNAWGAIIAAVITGVIAFTSMIIAKENKISEFRQIWINELRSNLAELISIFNVLSSDSGFNREDKDHARKNVNRVIAEINLRLNHNNPTKSEIELREAITDINVENVTNGRISSDYSKLTKASHEVLKEEWERVKRGENNYLKLKEWFGAISCVVIVILLFWLAVFSVMHSGMFKAPLF